MMLVCLACLLMALSLCDAAQGRTGLQGPTLGGIALAATVHYSSVLGLPLADTALELWWPGYPGPLPVVLALLALCGQTLRLAHGLCQADQDRAYGAGA